jgi:hypothetical protein
MEGGLGLMYGSVEGEVRVRPAVALREWKVTFRTRLVMDGVTKREATTEVQLSFNLLRPNGSVATWFEVEGGEKTGWILKREGDSSRDMDPLLLDLPTAVARELKTAWTFEEWNHVTFKYSLLTNGYTAKFHTTRGREDADPEDEDYVEFIDDFQGSYERDENRVQLRVEHATQDLHRLLDQSYWRVSEDGHTAVFSREL